MQRSVGLEKRLVSRRKRKKEIFFKKKKSLLPHIGSATKETRLAMATLAAGNLIAYATPSDLQK